MKFATFISLILLMSAAAWGQQSGCLISYVSCPPLSAKPTVLHIPFCGYESSGDTECVELPPNKVLEEEALINTPGQKGVASASGLTYCAVLSGDTEQWRCTSYSYLSTTQPSVTAQIKEKR